MSVHNIPGSRWTDVLEEFSRGHRGWLASVVTVGPGPQLVSRTEPRPLESITVAQTGGRPIAVCVRFHGGPFCRSDSEQHRCQLKNVKKIERLERFYGGKRHDCHGPFVRNGWQ